MKAWNRLIVILYLFIPRQGLAAVTEYPMPPVGDDIVGEVYTVKVQKGDSFNTIREKHEVSYEDLVGANPNTNLYKLKVGQTLVIPKQFILPKFRHGIVINVPELRLYYFTPDGKRVQTFPVGLGRPNWRTPLFSSTVVSKEADPAWHVPASIRNYVLNKTGKLLPETVPPGPKNPLGKYALHLRLDGYLIHGTNIPSSVGTFISSGCMRLLQEPIELLYQEVAIGTPVQVIYYPNKAGWRNNRLYLESHTPIDSYSALPSSELNTNVEVAIQEAIHLRPAEIDWDVVAKTVKQHLSIPKVIGYGYDVIA